MTKHGRWESSGQTPDSRPVTIQMRLPVLGVVHGVREAVHGLCIATGIQRERRPTVDRTARRSQARVSPPEHPTPQHRDQPQSRPSHQPPRETPLSPAPRHLLLP